jgi:DNA-binding PadR family transcriptional regulator
MSGYELKKRFSSSLGYGWRAYDTQIYRELKTLEASGLVSGRAEKGDRGPDRRVYAVTDAGRAALVAWLESPLDDTWYKSELTLRIWSMHLMGAAALADLLDGVESASRAYLEQLVARRAELREVYGPPEVTDDPHGVGHQLILEFDQEVAERKLAWIARVREVTRIRAMLDARAAPAR